MKKQRPEYEALVPRIASGELTRKQAAELSAEQTGLSPGSFTVRLHDSGQAEKLKATRGNAGDNSVRALVNTNPDKAQAYVDAIRAVTESGMNAEMAAKKFEVSYQYLLRKIKVARDAGQPKHPPQPHQRTKTLSERCSRTPRAWPPSPKPSAKRAYEHTNQTLKNIPKRRRQGRIR